MPADTAQPAHLDNWSRDNAPIDIEKLQKDSFACGLELMLDGLAARLDRAR